jgi:CRISPR-associated endonuclease Csn1
MVGLTYDKAAVAAGYGLTNTDGDGRLNLLPYYGAVLQRHVAFGTGNLNDPDEVREGKIANPSVHIALNQVRRVVNKLIDRYGKPTEVVFELTRDIKLGWKRAREIEREQKDRQDENEALKEELHRLNVGVSTDAILRLRLFRELAGSDGMTARCVYSGEAINLTRLFSGDVEVDHILPYSQTLDDSLANKVLCLTSANRVKGNQSPFQAFSHSPSGYDWPAILDRAASLKRNRRRRFDEDALSRFEEEGGFLARQLTDTAYMSRVAREYLSFVCQPNKVWVTTGQLTAMLRKKWGLNKLISDGEDKNRLDQRHHAIDATVIACVDRSLVHRIARAAEASADRHAGRLIESLDYPWPTFRDGLEHALTKMVVSYRPDHSPAAALHNETAYGQAGADMVPSGHLVKGEVKSYVRIASLVGEKSEKFLEHVIDPEIGKRLAQIADSAGSDKKMCQAALEKFSSDTGIKRIRWREILSVIPLIDDHSGKPVKFVKADGNYCIEIFKEPNRKWSSETIPTFTANQPRYAAFMKSPEYRKQSFSGHELVMRLIVNDMVKVRKDGSAVLYRVQKLSAGRIVLAHHFGSGDLTRNDFSLKGVKTSLSLSAEQLRKENGKRVFVDEIGRVFG